MVSRRQFLSHAVASAFAVSMGSLPAGVFAQATSAKRFVFVNCFGAADGLDILRPVGDANYQAIRQAVPRGLEGLPVGTLNGVQFALNPRLPAIHDLYTAGQALLFHGVGLDYSECPTAVRSHFSSQNMLSTLSPVAYRVGSGFLGRVVELRSYENLAVSDTIPPVLKGKKRKLSSTWSADVGRMPNADFMERLDRLLASEVGYRQALKRGYEDALLVLPEVDQTLPANMRELARAMEFAKAKSMPIIAIGTRGWDAHSGEWADKSAYHEALAVLNATIQTIRASLSEEEWQKTVVLVCSEFGRTVKPNGSGGTDHGTGTMAMVLGGAVKGGKLAGTWPGLAEGQLWQGRDLKVTTNLLDLEAAVLQGVFNFSAEEQLVVFGKALDVPPYLEPRRLMHV